jgi:hypothetical protein
MRELAVLLRGWLLMLVLGACLPALAQRLPQPSPRPAGDDSAAAELATSAWTRSQLEAWWAALRHHTVAGGDRLDVPADLLPPDDAAAWRPVTMPDVRPRPGGTCRRYQRIS